MSLSDGLVGSWRLNNDFVDAASGNNGTGIAMTFAPGKIGPGGVFTPANLSKIVLADPAALRLSSYTITAQIKHNGSAGYQTIFENWYETTNAGIRFMIDPSGRMFWMQGNNGGGNANGVSPFGLGTGTFLHVGITFDSASTILQLYYQGSTSGMGSISTGAPVYNANTVAQIGASDGSQHLFNGMIDELKIWNRALSATEMAQDYNGGNGTSLPPPIYVYTEAESELIAVPRPGVAFNRVFYFGDAGGGDPPVAGDEVPTADTDVTPDQVLQYDVTDDQGSFALNLVAALLADGKYEMVHDGVGFAPGYTGSSRSAITNGFRYFLQRDAGWPLGAVRIRHWSVDSFGGVNG